ncbi:hypothetical protein IL306_003743 [Fusarium sp. DS 682]|nr:hypothetical protein IL306_003743 [Fusarium sp. DS 682]
MHFLRLLASFAAVSTGLLIPLVSPGPYPVGLTIESLMDEARWDPYAPSDSPQRRRILLSSFIPISDKSKTCPDGHVDVAYMPGETRKVFGRQAEAMGLSPNIFQDLHMRVCQLHDLDASTHHHERQQTKFPVMIFSPGRGVSRLMYSAMARSIASHGYVVITIDHAYDASIIEFPDGTAITGVVGEANQTVLEAVQVRSQDISFIIDQAKDNVTTKSLLGFTGADRIFVFGHSIGGASAVSTVFNDERVQGVINLDGDMLGPVVKTGLDKPLFLIGRPHSREQGPSWNETWHNQHGAGMMLQIDGTTHQSFLDAPLLAALKGVPEESKAKVQAALGTINGKRMASLVIQLTVAILEYVIDGAENRLCRLVGGQPEVTVLETKGINCQ